MLRWHSENTLYFKNLMSDSDWYFQETYAMLIKWDVPQDIVAMCFDTTSTNRVAGKKEQRCWRSYWENHYLTWLADITCLNSWFKKYSRRCSGVQQVRKSNFSSSWKRNGHNWTSPIFNQLLPIGSMNLVWRSCDKVLLLFAKKNCRMLKYTAREVITRNCSSLVWLHLGKLCSFSFKAPGAMQNAR
jgi:hypothetical protein